jgi:CPA2 family monovalent cation:H+ antiporter-2
MENIILITLITGTIAVVLNLILKRFEVPPIIGYIFTGAIMGTFLSVSGTTASTLEHIAEFGIVFLMFTIGLELKLENLIDMRKQVFTYGTLQVLGIMAVFTTVAYFAFNLDIKASLVIGGALSLSSTAIVLKIMNESNEISKEYGQNTLGILIFQDLAVIPILLMLTILSNSTSTISSMLINIALGGAALIVVMIIFGKYFLEYILKIVDNADTHELFIMIVLIIAIGSSYLAHSLGFTYSMGAFIGGMLIAETHYKHQIEADLIPFRDLFLALFFVTVGMQIDINFLFSNVLQVITASIFIMIIKGITIFGILYIFTKQTVAFKTSLAILQVGEFSFVVFTYATSSNLLDKDIGQLLTLAVIISMIATPFILKNIFYFVDLIYGQKKVMPQSDTFKSCQLYHDHIIVCGYGSFAKKIIKNLKEYKLDYTVVVNNYQFYEEAIKAGEKAIFGKPEQKSILIDAGLLKARVVIIGLHDMHSIESISHTVAAVKKDVKVMAKVTNKNIFDHGINVENFVDIYSISAQFISANAATYIKKDII